jgi:hypothetical protein
MAQPAPVAKWKRLAMGHRDDLPLALTGPAGAKVSHQVDNKAFATLRARLALAGYALSRSDPTDGPLVFFAARWGLVRELRDLAEATDFAERVGAPQ